MKASRSRRCPAGSSSRSPTPRRPRSWSGSARPSWTRRTASCRRSGSWRSPRGCRCPRARPGPATPAGCSSASSTTPRAARRSTRSSGSAGMRPKASSRRPPSRKRTSSSSAGAARPPRATRPGPRSSRRPSTRSSATRPCDIAVVKQRGSRTIKRILVPVRGGPHAELALRYADAIARHHDATVVVLHLVPPGITMAVRAQAEHALTAFIKQHLKGRGEALLKEAPNVRNAILREAERSDLVVMGASATAAGANGETLPVRRPARGDRRAGQAERRRRQDARPHRASRPSTASRRGPRPSPPPIARPRRRGRSRPRSSAGSASRTSTTPSSWTCGGSSRSRRSRA